MKKKMLTCLTVILLCNVLVFQYVYAVPDTQINSQYDLVFALDNSLEMARYDSLDDLS